MLIAEGTLFLFFLVGITVWVWSWVKSMPINRDPTVLLPIKEEKKEQLRSEIYPDDLYIGRTIDIESSLQYTLPVEEMAFTFPSSELYITEFNSFNIDQNKMELVKTNSEYVLILDQFEGTIYLMQKIRDVMMFEDSRCIDLPDIIFRNDDSKKEVKYAEPTGLIFTKIEDKKYVLNMFKRKYSNVENEEYCLMFMQNGEMVKNKYFYNNLCTMYIGIELEINQIFRG